MTDGANAWTNVTTSSWYWFLTSSPGNLVRYGYIDGVGQNSALASTVLTRNGTTITKMDMKFDNAESWYTGTGTPSTGQKDLRSIATHEFGHGLGLGHTQVSCPNDSTRPTMCAGYPALSTYVRSLESDDRSGVAASYP